MDSLARRQPHPIDVRVGYRIRLARRMRKVTLAELAVCLQVTYQQVQKYESGANRVAPSTLVRIASALSFPLDHFFVSLPELGHDVPAGSAPYKEGLEAAVIVVGIALDGLRKRVLSLMREIARIDADLTRDEIH